MRALRLGFLLMMIVVLMSSFWGIEEAVDFAEAQAPMSETTPVFLIPCEDPWGSGVAAWEGYWEGSYCYRDNDEARESIDVALNFLQIASPAGYESIKEMTISYGMFMRLLRWDSAFFDKLIPTFQNAAGFMFLPEAYRYEVDRAKMLRQLHEGTFPEGWRRIVFVNLPPCIPRDADGRANNYFSVFGFWALWVHEIEHSKMDAIRPELDRQFGVNRWPAEEVLAWNAMVEWFDLACPRGTKFPYYDTAWIDCPSTLVDLYIGQAGYEFSRLKQKQRAFFLEAYGDQLQPDLYNYLVTLR